MAENQQNWAENLTYGSARIHRPGSVEEVQALVAKATKVKALGTRHSFNSIADTDQDHISTERLNQVIDLDRDRMTVTIEGGVSYGTLSKHLYLEGFALHNLASLPHISVAGACATATHGSGVNNGNLATAVVAMELVNASGELIRYNQSNSEFYGAVVNIGALGVVTSLTLKIEPAYQVSQYVYQDLPFCLLEEHFDTIAASGYSVSLFTTWKSDTIDQVWQKCVNHDGEAPASLFEAKLASQKLHPLPDHPADNCTEQLGLAGSWHERLAHFKMNFTPSSGEELQSEYIVPRHHAFAALSAINKMREAIIPILHVSEIRTTASDDLWLSSAYERDVVCIHFTWKKNWAAVQLLLPLIEQVLAPFGARPHWGKLFTMKADKVRSLYPKMNDFKTLANELDPTGKFRNEFLIERVFG